MVNGILRNLERSLDRLPTIPQDDPVRYLSTLYSHPAWLVEEMLMLPGDWRRPPGCWRPTTAAPRDRHGQHPENHPGGPGRDAGGGGGGGQPHPWLDGCLLLSRTGELERLSAFQEGLFYVQDPASRLAVLAAGPEPGMRVLDCCAAPGGKTFAAALAMGDRGEMVSCDLHPHKKRLIRAGADRLGLTCVRPVTADGRQFRPEWEGAFDLVLVDAPCSGLGVIRKKPDIRYKDPAPLAGLPQVQRAILDNAARYVRPGGALLYSTCTLLRRENEEVVAAFLQGHT